MIPAVLLPLVTTGIELALNAIEQAIIAGRLTPEQVAKRVDAAVKAADASEQNLDDAIARAETRPTTGG